MPRLTESALSSQDTVAESSIDERRVVVSSFAIFGKNIELTDVTRSDSETFAHEMPEAFRVYKALLADGAECDTTIECGGRSMAAHKALLAGRIPYFEMFVHKCSEGQAGVITVATEIAGIVLDPARVWELIAYAYDGRLHVTEENAFEMIKAADYLLMTDIVHEIVRFLVDRATCDNALSLLSLAQSAANWWSSLMEERLLRFIDANFVPISRTAGFKQLPLPDLISILKRDTLRVDSEIQIVEAICAWIGDDRGRWTSGPRLLECVRFAALPDSYVSETLWTKDWVLTDPECATKLGLNKAFDRPRHCKDSPQLALIVGKPVSNRNRNERVAQQWKIMMFNVMDRNLTEIVTSRKPHVYAMAVTVGWKAYFISRGTDPTLVLDLRTNEWSELPGLSEPHGDAAVVAINGLILVAGGRELGNDDGLSSVFCLDTKEDAPEWKARAPMMHGRWGAASCLVGGLFYVFGGNDASKGGESGAAEVYDIVKDEWSELAPMLHPKYSHTATAIDGRILIVGGYYNRQKDNELFDPKTNAWKALEPRTKGHSCFSAAFASGGRLLFMTNEGVAPFEVFNVHTGYWENSTMEDQDWSMKFDPCVGEAAIFVPFPATAALPMTAIEDPWTYGEDVKAHRENCEDNEDDSSTDSDE